MCITSGTLLLPRELGKMARVTAHRGPSLREVACLSKVTLIVRVSQSESPQSGHGVLVLSHDTLDDFRRAINI